MRPRRVLHALRRLQHGHGGTLLGETACSGAARMGKRPPRAALPLRTRDNLAMHPKELLDLTGGLLREILKLEKELGAARHRLGAMRRAGYHTDETD